MENELREVALSPAMNMIILLAVVILYIGFTCLAFYISKEKRRNDNQDLFLKDLDKNSKL